MILALENLSNVDSLLFASTDADQAESPITMAKMENWRAAIIMQIARGSARALRKFFAVSLSRIRSVITEAAALFITI